MKFNKILLISIVLLAILSIGAVSAQDNVTDDISSSNQDDTIQLNLNDDNDQIGDGASTYTKQVYVNATGSDSGAGSEASPYATINKAISDVEASDDAAIYLGSGTFSGDGNTNLNIALSHKNHGGSLTFIGASDGSTIIDGNEVSPIFASISADSIVILKNIVFTKGKNNLGSAITSAGNLTVDNCVFENNYATTLGALYFNGANDIIITNTTFKNNYGGNGYADMYYSYSGTYLAKVIDCKFIGSKSGNANLPSFSIQYSETYIIGNLFKDLTGGSTSGTFMVSYGNGQKFVKNNKFVNCNFTGTGDGGIFTTQNSYLENNIFVNCTTKTAQIFAQTEFNARIKYLNTTIDGTNFKLYANVTDDVGNSISTSAGKVYFYIDGEQVGSSVVTKGVASVSVSKLLDNGNYTISGEYKYSENPFECVIENGTATVDFNHNPLELWVSTDGNDTNGTGSEDKPFLTLKHALDYGFENTVDLTVHLKDGIYNGSANRGLSYSPVGKLTIIGESYGNAIIDAEKQAATIFTFGQNIEVNLINLTLLNATGRIINVYTLNLIDSIIKNAGSFNGQYNTAKILFNNVTYENSGQVQAYNIDIYNSLFLNNDGQTSTGLIWAAASGNDKYINIQNTTFIGNKIAGYSGGAAFYVQANAILINNRYERNTVSGTSASYIAYVSGNKIVSINETFIENNVTSKTASYFSQGTDPTLYIENIIFENNTASGDCAGLAVCGGLINGAKFINNTANGNGGAIFISYHSTSINVDNLVLKDVIFENNKAARGNDIFIQETTSTSYNAGVLENITITAQSKTVDVLADTLTVTLTHESGAVIGGGNIDFYLDGNKIGTSKVNNGEATFEYLGFKNGTYDFSEIYSLNSNNYKNINGTITVSLKPLLDNITLYVSDSRGDDENGDGTFDKPYKTIQTALSAGYQKSPIVTVNVLEGTYLGDKNVNLEIPTGLKITINGAGTDKTFINDETAEFFIKALAGDEYLKISNLTINRTGKRLNQMINIVEGATVILDNVYVTRGIGNDGGAISSAGTLIVKDSYFYNNGLGEKSFSSRAGGAIYNTGTLLIYNTIFYANHASGAAGGYGGAVIYNAGDLEIYSSILNDSVCDYGMNMAYMAIQGTATSTIKMYDTLVTITGRTAAEILPTDLYNLNGRAVPTIGVGQAATGIFVNCTFDGANVLNHAGSVVFGNVNNWNPVYIRNITVINSTFKDLKAPTVVYGTNAANTPVSYRVFEGCTFDNVQFLYATLTNTDKVHITVKDSVILSNGTQMIGGPALVNSDIKNNWWGSNNGTYDLTTVKRVAGGANAFYNVNPDVRTTTKLENWIAVAATVHENEVILEFQLFDGETLSKYSGPVNREFTISAVNGTLGVSNGTLGDEKVSIPFQATDLRFSITVNVDNEEIVMEIDQRSQTVINVIGINEDLELITYLTDIEGTPIADAVVYYTIGNYANNVTTDGNGIALIPCVENGEMTIKFPENSQMLGSNTTFNIDGVVKSDANVIITIADEIEIGDDVAVIVSIENATGNVTLNIDGKDYELQLDEGAATYTIPSVTAGKHTIVAIYNGDDTLNPANAIKSFDLTKKEANINIAIPQNIKIGDNVKVVISIANATGKATIIFDGIKTEENLVDGVINYTISSVAAGKHDIVVVYSGDEAYESAYNSGAFDVDVFTTSFVNVTISGDLKISAALVSSQGKVLNNTTVFYTIKNVTYNTTTDSQGIATIQGVSDEVITIAYNGEGELLATSTSVDLTNMSPAKSDVNIELESSSITSYAIDTKANEKGSKWFVGTLKDDKGVISNASVEFTFNGIIYKLTTDNDGKFKFQLNENVANTYTGTFVYLGDETHNAKYAMVTAKINKKSTKIVAKAKKFKAKTKTKKYKVTLKTIAGSSSDKKAHLSAGKVVTLKIKGKTFKAKTNAKGKATFKIKKLTKKGKHKAVITFKGDKTYKKATKKVKITIK